MKFSIKKTDILGELQLLQGIVEKRNTMPILANILISAGNSELELIGTDLEVGMKAHVAAEVEKEGAITISGKKVYEIVRSLSENKDVVFNRLNDDMMEITSGASEFKVLCMPKEDYPQIPEPKFEKNIRFPLDRFQGMIDCVYPAITQEQRYYLNGALMILKEGRVEMVSTDGHRLAFAAMGVDDLKVEDEIRGIVSKKTLGEIRKFEEDTLEFDLDENNLFFRVGSRTMMSRAIEGKFPNYEAVIPSESSARMTVSRDSLIDALRRVSILSAERSKGVRFNIESQSLNLFSSNPEMGEARDKVETEYDGEKLEIGFNAQYLLDFLTTAKGESIRFEMTDENSAVLMKPAEEGELTYKYVLMPMKI